MSKIYTKTGDFKTTCVTGGIRVGKDSDVIEALGTLDEFNSALGLLLAAAEASCKAGKGKNKKFFLRGVINRIQNDCFVIGSELSSIPARANAKNTPGSRKRMEAVRERTLQMEKIIDHLQASLPPLHKFILPEGSVTGALFQVARSVSRRMERRIVRFSRKFEVDPAILAYTNRLSDLLFVLSRAVNHKGGEKETIWK